MLEPRRKNPEALRAALIEAAIRLACDHGLPAVSIDAVARAAGVTKGGLFHHFPNKQALIEAVFARLIEDFDAEIAALMAVDPEPHGRFTRAYLQLSFLPDTEDDAWDALWHSFSAEPALSRIWTDWLDRRLTLDPGAEAGLALETVRFAADGIWGGKCVGVMPANPDRLHDHLRAMTLPNPA